ncbi:MAG: hypothetical protein RL685_4695 [Pseudomonadota bacterium]
MNHTEFHGELEWRLAEAIYVRFKPCKADIVEVQRLVESTRHID